MKRFGLTTLTLVLVLAGCAQQKGQTKDAAKVGELESKFAAFQEQQRARDTEIDLRLREIASRLDTLTSGKAPAARGPSAKQLKQPKQPDTRPSRRPIVAGQIIPYTELMGNGAPRQQSAPAPAPMQPGQTASAAGQPIPVQQPQGQTPRPMTVSPGQSKPMATQAQQTAPVPVNPDLVVTPPVVTLGPTYLNVPPASQPRNPQPYTGGSKGKSAPVKENTRASRKASKERAPEPVAAPEPAPMTMPSMEPATPPPAIPAPPQVKSEAPQAPAAVPAPAASSASNASMEEQRLYTEALRAVSSNKNDEGRKKFNEFISKYPDSSKTPEALYWIGESYMGDKSYNQAILSFKDLATRFPKDDKAAVATYRTAEAYELLGDKSNAGFNLKLLLQQYPNSEFVGKAKQKLKQLGQ